MTKDEWLECKNASLMIQFLWTQEPYSSVAKKFEVYPTSEDWMDYLSVEMPLYKFYLASCRNIWPLLTQEESRKGIESPRVCQRLNNLRNWNYEKIKSLYIRIS